MNDTIRADTPLYAGDTIITPAWRGGTGLVCPSWYTPGGRLTLTSGTPVTNTDLTAQTTLYYTPAVHDQIALFDGARWRLYQFPELSVLASSLSASTVYDVFVYPSGGLTPGVECLAWSSDTARATSLSLQNGASLKSTDLTRRWVGIARTDANTKFTDSSSGATNSGRWVCNAYNKVARTLFSSDSSVRTTSSTTNWAQIGAVAVDFIVDGTTPDVLDGKVEQSASNLNLGIVAAASGTALLSGGVGGISNGGGAAINSVVTSLTETLSAGRYKRLLCFYAQSGTATVNADASTPQTGLRGTIWS